MGSRHYVLCISSSPERSLKYRQAATAEKTMYHGAKEPESDEGQISHTDILLCDLKKSPHATRIYDLGIRNYFGEITFRNQNAASMISS